MDCEDCVDGGDGQLDGVAGEHCQVVDAVDVASDPEAGRGDAEVTEDAPVVPEDEPVAPEDEPAPPEDEPAPPEDEPAPPEDEPEAHEVVPDSSPDTVDQSIASHTIEDQLLLDIESQISTPGNRMSCNPHDCDEEIVHILHNVPVAAFSLNSAFPTHYDDDDDDVFDDDGPETREISEDSVDFFNEFAAIRQRADRPRRRQVLSVVEEDFSKEQLADVNAEVQRRTFKRSAISEAEEALEDGGDLEAPQPAPRSKSRSRLGSSPTNQHWLYGPELVAGPEAENVYMQLMYSVIHAISFSDCSLSGQEVFAVLRDQFRMADDKHEQLLETVRQWPPPEVCLQLGVVEARNLKGKDVNGMSDPYCNIWISSNKQKQQNSTMKPRTLNPVWKEIFNLCIKDANQDLLQLEVWDFNPEETVSEKMGRFGDVNDFRGFGKLLKQIAVATTSPAGKPAHEFLGLLAVPLKLIPANGMERWFPLEGREKSKMKDRGEIRLSLSLSASNETTYSQQENFIHYERIVRIFAEHHFRSDPDWRGHFSETSSVILRQFAAHRSLPSSLTDICLWSVYSHVLSKRSLDTVLLLALLQKLGPFVKNDDNLAEEVQNIFWTASDNFVKATMAILRNVRINQSLMSNNTQLNSLLISEKLSDLVAGLCGCRCLAELAALGCAKPGFTNLTGRVSDAIMMGAADWFSRVVEKRKLGGPISDDDRLENSIRICQLLMADLKSVLTWQNEIFVRVLKVPCFAIVYQYYESQLAALCKPSVDSITRTVTSSDLSEDKIYSIALEASGESVRPVTCADGDHDPKLTMGTGLFELYLCLQQFHRLAAALTQPQKENLKLTNFHLWFSGAVGRWLHIALYKAMLRIDKAISMDSLQSVDALAKHSSSAVDTVSVFYQIKTFWEQLSWPDTEGALAFVMKIIDDVNRCSNFYAEVTGMKLERLNSTSSVPFYVTLPTCVAIHSIVHIRESIGPLADELGVNRLCQALQQDNVDASRVSRRTKETLTDNAVDNINAKLDEIFYSIARRIEAEFGAMISNDSEGSFNLAYWERLIHYLDANLITLKQELDSGLFDRVLELVCQRVLHCFYDAVCIHVENKKPPSCFKHWEDLLKMITNFFYGDSESEEKESKDEILAKIRRVINLHGSDSDHLIHQYRLERIQNSVSEVNRGKLSVRALFFGETLIVDVLNGRNLKSMDTRGSADPYVKLQLLPHHKFTESAVLKSKVHKHTLFPLFDETFTFFVSPELQTCGDCFIVLMVKDYDLLGSNEFIGEAFLPFQQIPRGDNAHAIKEFDQIHLPLSLPPNKESEYLQILESRSWDKLAKDFVKREKKRMHTK